MGNHFREPDTFVQFTSETRNSIELAIEGLLKLLDAIDGNPDLEDGADDEYYLTGCNTDIEGDFCDDEPSLTGSYSGKSWELDCELSGPIEGGQGL